jgi:hypothetical protein
MNKQCSTCQADKPLSGFRKDKSTKSGYQSRCKTCARSAINKAYKKDKDKILKRNHERYLEARQFVMEHKQACGCTYCDERETVCLDFHHIFPEEKSFGLSRVTTQSLETIAAEIDKCVLVCKNCHAKIHAGLIEV